MKFAGRNRCNGDPMVTHSTGIAELSVEKGFGDDYLIVALLYDVLEDTNATVEEIRQELPFVTEEMIQGVISLTKTDDMSLEGQLI